MTSRGKIKLSVDSARAQRLVEVGIALSAETDLAILLEKIISYARELTNADAGTLYTVNSGNLDFKIIQNDTLGIRLGGPGSPPITLDPVPITKSSVSGYVAVTGEMVNIEDVYESKEFDFTGPRRYDERTGYRSKSMLVVPMRDHEGEIIGVLQLLNAKKVESGEVIAFPHDVESIASAFASQAAVSLNNAKLIAEVRDLFESLIRVMATAVDAKSPYTGNHVQRVAMLNSMLAQAINDATEGPFATVSFNADEMREIRIAGWLHDVGKLTTPTYVMDKATKLQGVFDRVELIRLKFELAKAKIEAQALRAALGEEAAQSLSMKGAEEEIAALGEECEFLAALNQPSEFVTDDKMERLNDIAKRRGELITGDEAKNLSIRKGSLNDEEITLMRSHVTDTAKILAEVPFSKTRKLKNVPLFAAQHHEKLNGKGYPDGIPGDKLPVQSRILAVADFYEALSAKDRPYKKPMPIEMIQKIMGFCVKDGELDGDIVNLLFTGKVFDKFEEEYEKERSPKA